MLEVLEIVRGKGDFRLKVKGVFSVFFLGIGGNVFLGRLYLIFIVEVYWFYFLGWDLEIVFGFWKWELWRR